MAGSGWSKTARIEARTGFAREFTHVSESRSRIADLPISLCAVLLAEACNLPLNTFVQAGSKVAFALPLAGESTSEVP